MRNDTSAGLPSFRGFTTIKLLGMGGMGATFLVVRNSDGKELVAKTTKSRSPNKDTRTRFYREAHTLIMARGIKQFVHVIENHQEVRRPYFIMEYVSGGDLEQVLAQRHVPYENIVKMLVPVADGLHQFHVLHYLHRDFKPANLLFDPLTGSLKIADCGLAKLQEEEPVTDPNQVMGTEGYISPMVFRFGARHATAGADIFAFGRTLEYVALYAMPVSHTRTTWDKFTKRASRRKDDHGKLVNSPMDEDLKAIVLRCYAEGFDERYRGMDEVRDDLRAYAEGRPISAKTKQVYGDIYHTPRLRVRRFMRRMADALAASFEWILP